MNLQNSYFAISNPLFIIDRWLHPRKYSNKLMLGNASLNVSWTARAEQKMQCRHEPLIVEMQLYFSCMVKKRVLFHDQTEFDTVVVNDQLQILFRPVQSQQCSPEEFAQTYPVKQQLKSISAIKMKPKSLNIDFKKGQWVGSYDI